MAKQKTVIDELAEKADTMLAEVWKRLGAEPVTKADIDKLVEGWSIKHKIFLEKEEEKQLKKEAKQSDAN